MLLFDGGCPLMLLFDGGWRPLPAIETSARFRRRLPGC
jgi:hypothetical protein